jgi:hypothetical protein
MDISTSIEQAIASYFSNWLGQHIYLAWILAHPLPSLFLLIVGILLLLGLFKGDGADLGILTQNTISTASAAI